MLHRPKKAILFPTKIGKIGCTRFQKGKFYVDHLILAGIIKSRDTGAHHHLPQYHRHFFHPHVIIAKFVTPCHTPSLSIFTKYSGDLEFFRLVKSYLSHRYLSHG